MHALPTCTCPGTSSTTRTLPPTYAEGTKVRMHLLMIDLVPRAWLGALQESSTNQAMSNKRQCIIMPATSQGTRMAGKLAQQSTPASCENGQDSCEGSSRLLADGVVSYLGHRPGGLGKQPSVLRSHKDTSLSTVPMAADTADPSQRCGKKRRPPMLFCTYQSVHDPLPLSSLPVMASPLYDVWFKQGRVHKGKGCSPLWLLASA